MSGEARSEDAYKHADYVIQGLLKAGHADYTAGREELARLFDEDLWNGNWDSTTCFEEAGLQLEELRLIQEDEFEQHMDDESEELEESKLGYFGGHYVFST